MEMGKAMPKNGSQKINSSLVFGRVFNAEAQRIAEFFVGSGIRAFGGLN